MKKLLTLMALALLCKASTAQTDSVPTKKNKDTLRIGNIIIIKDEAKNDTSRSQNNNGFWGRKRGKLANVSTNWGIVDIGFTNYSDNTNYGSTGSYLYSRSGAAPLGQNDLGLNTGKSVNINIWFFMQRVNLVKHHLNLKYGLGLDLNNYRYKSSISYLEQNPFVTGQAPAPIIFRDSISFKKNKLAADYLTIPLMLNYSSNPEFKNKGISISAGISAGYLYSQRNKQVSNERGKQKNKGNYDLEQFKLCYIAEIGVGPIHLYGSYTPNSIYKRELDIRPYTFGLRLSNW